MCVTTPRSLESRAAARRTPAKPGCDEDKDAEVGALELMAT